MCPGGGGGALTTELGTFPAGESFQKSAFCPWKEVQNLPRPHRRKEILRYFDLIGLSRGIFQKLPKQGCRGHHRVRFARKGQCGLSVKVIAGPAEIDTIRLFHLSHLPGNTKAPTHSSALGLTGSKSILITCFERVLNLLELTATQPTAEHAKQSGAFEKGFRV